jgi:hypothetical protein
MKIITGRYSCFSILQLLFLLAVANPVAAFTRFSPDPSSCQILGDPDVYGIGIRLSFYLQWVSLVIFMATSPDNADVARIASNITISAVYINAFRGAHLGGLVSVEWDILWFMTFFLVILNRPIDTLGYKKNAGSMGTLLLLWAIYYLAFPWVYFKGIDIGRKHGCDVKTFIFTSISIYAKGYRTAFKVLSIFFVFMGGILLAGAVFTFILWMASWNNKEVEEYRAKPNLASAFLRAYKFALELLQYLSWRQQSCRFWRIQNHG